MPIVKICGITNTEDALFSLTNGADLLGFVFVEKSPRFLLKEQAKEIIEDIRSKTDGFAGITGLFLDQELSGIIEMVLFCGLDVIQLHGDQTPEFCSLLKRELEKKDRRNVKVIKTFKVDQQIMLSGAYIPDDYLDVDYYLFDTFSREAQGGTGETFSWKKLKKNVKSFRKPFFIAGGLNPDNISEAIRILEPFGVDVSSGVEMSPGKKDPGLLKEFIKNAKKN